MFENKIARFNKESCAFLPRVLLRGRLLLLLLLIPLQWIEAQHSRNKNVGDGLVG